MSKLKENIKLDRHMLEIAEALRSQGKVEGIPQISGIGLDTALDIYNTYKLDNAEETTEQLAVVACLARIFVDSSKSMANKSFRPVAIGRSLAPAVQAIQTIYREPQFTRPLSHMTQDHLGREHFFLAEMQRDVAKVAQAAAPLYLHEERSSLLDYAERVLQRTATQLAEGHPTRPLILIELELSKLRRGLPIDYVELIENFQTLIRQDGDKNPERVATVASWFIVQGEKHEYRQIRDFGEVIFRNIIKKHPQFEFMIPQEKKKAKLSYLRDFLVGHLSQLTLFPDDKAELRRRIIE